VLNGRILSFFDDLSPRLLASEMTYIVSGGALNSTHSLTPLHYHAITWITGVDTIKFFT